VGVNDIEAQQYQPVYPHSFNYVIEQREEYSPAYGVSSNFGKEGEIEAK